MNDTTTVNIISDVASTAIAVIEGNPVGIIGAAAKDIGDIIGSSDSSPSGVVNTLKTTPTTPEQDTKIQQVLNK